MTTGFRSDRFVRVLPLYHERRLPLGGWAGPMGVVSMLSVDAGSTLSESLGVSSEMDTSASLELLTDR